MTPIAYINVEKRRLEFAEPIKWHTPTVANLDRVPLYTQRTWVGLTDDEMYEAVRPLCKADSVARSLFDISKDEYRAIEAKLKEKNT